MTTISPKSDVIRRLAAFVLLSFVFFAGAAWAQTIITIGTGTLTQRYPLGNLWGYERSASIYTAAEVTIPGVITKVSWYATATSTIPRPIKIYLKETTASTHTADTWANMITGATLVYDNSSVTITGDAWNEFNLTTGFTYSHGSNNLLVLVEANYGGAGGGSGTYGNPRYSTATNQHQYWYADNTPPPGNGYLSSSRPNIQLTLGAPTNMTYGSSTTTQNTTMVFAGTTDQWIIGIQVLATGTLSPLSLTQFGLSTNGTTSIADMSNAKIYCTGTSSTFSPVNQFGSTVASPPSGSYTISGSQTLYPGTTYFWLAYDINSGATEYNVVDAECTSLTVADTSRTPTVSAPAGNRTIRYQLTGTKTIGSGGNYTSFAAAIADLNFLGVGTGGVTFSVASGETFNESLLRITATGTAGNPIKFQKSSTANPVLQVTGTSATTDAAIRIISSDYITFDGITVQNAGTSASDWVEYGFFFLDSTGTNGCQYNTVKNCTVTLDAANTSSRGVFLDNAATDASGANSNNKFYNNTIQNAYNGYYFLGTTGYYDDGNEVSSLGGGVSEVKNIGGGTTAVYPMYVYYQTNFKMYGTKLGPVSAGGTVAIYGIYMVGTTGSATIDSNDVYGFSGGGGVYGIYTSSSGSSTIRKNKVHDFVSSSTTTGGLVYGIYFSSTTTGNCYNNFVYDLRTPTSTATTASSVGIYLSGGTTINVFYNTVYLDYLSTVSANTSAAIVVGSTTPTSADLRNNIFVNKVDVSTGTLAVAFRKTGTSLTNLAATTNNNLYYAGTPSAKNLIFYDGTNPDQTLAGYKNRVAPLDQAAVSVDPAFVSSVSPYNLHINTAVATPIESGGTIVSTPIAVDDDIDANVRFGSTGYGGTGSAPDIGADEFEGIAVDLTAPNINYAALPPTHLTGNRTLKARITDPSGVQQSSAGAPRLWYKKGSAGSYVQTTGTYTTADTFQFTFDHSLIGTVSAGDTVFYYVAAQDSVNNAGTIPPGSTPTINPPNAAVASPNFYRIRPAMAGTYTIGGTESYATLKLFFDELNNAVITGNVTGNIVADVTETASAVLNETMEYPSGSNFTVTIQPSGAVRTVSGNIAGALIDLNGADRVTFNGNIGSTKSLILSNDNTGTSAVTIRLQNGATNNLVTWCDVRGAGTSSTLGTILFGTGANSNNTISNNTIRDAAGVPANAIYSSSTSNAPDAISGNWIYNFTNTGIRLSSLGDGWTVSNNSIYQTATRSTALYGIYVYSGSGHTISGNSIGGSAADRSGAPFTSSGGTIYGIYLYVGTTSPTSVQGNTMANILCTYSSGYIYMMYVSSGVVNIGTTTGNVLGGGAAAYDTVSGSYYIYCIYKTSSGDAEISNNTIGNIGYYGLYYPRGIYCSSGANTIKNNTIRDFNSTGTSTTIGGLCGIYLSSSADSQLVEGNAIYNIKSLATGTAAYAATGIYIASVSSDPIPTKVLKNRIYGLTADGTGTGTSSPQIFGIYVASGDATYANNMISVGASVGNEARVTGIRVAATTYRNNWYFNSVRVEGTTASGSNISYAFNRSGTDTVTLRNNLFSNVRTGGGGNVAIANTNAAATNWLASSSNYNVLNSASSSEVGQWLSTGLPIGLVDWQSASGGDGNSQSGVTVNFVNTATGDLHMNMGLTLTSLESGGTNVPGYMYDFDNQTRPGPPGSVNGGAYAADLGADEFDGVPPNAMQYVSSTVAQTPGYVYPRGRNYSILRIEVVTSGFSNPRVATDFTLNTNGSTNALGDLDSAKIFYTGGSNVFSTATQFGTAYASPPAAPTIFTITGSQTLVEGTNYFWLAYDIDTLATVSNVVDGECTSITISTTPRIPSTTAPSGYSTIQGPLSGTYTIGTAQTAPFNTLTGAVGALMVAGASDSVTFLLSDALYTTPAESFPITIGSYFGLSATNKLTIKPAPATTVTVSGVSASSIIKLNGVDYATIDGSNSGGTSRDMTIVNTSSATNTAAIWLSSLGTGQGAMNNTVRNCVLMTGLNPTSSTNSTFCVISSGSSIGTTSDGVDNNNNVFQNNEIKKARYGIYVRGGASASNTDNRIMKNLIGGSYFGSETIGKVGICVQYQNGPEITENNIQYVGGTYAYTSAGADRVGIGLGSEAWTPTATTLTNAVVSRNVIHDVVDERTFAAVGIVLAGSGTPTTNRVFNNAIYNVKANGTASDQAVGIGIASGDGDSVVFNSIAMSGDLDPVGTTAASQSGVGIRISSTSAVNLTLLNNAVAVNFTSNTATLKHYAAVAPASYSFGTGGANYNLYYADPSSTQMVLGGIGTTVPYTEVPTLAGWQGSFTPNQDLNSLASNPLMNGYDNPRPQPGSPLLAAGVTIPSISIDVLGVTRGSPPTIGAYEVAGDFSAPLISYTPLGTTSSTANRPLTATITDVSGVQTGANGPRLYYKKTTDLSYAFDASPNIVGNDYTFIINYTNVGGGSVSPGDTIRYYVAAQDINGYVRTQPAGGAGSSPPGTTPPPAPDFYKIIGTPMSGDYTIGLTPFNAAAGRNLAVEMRTRRVVCEVQVEEEMVVEPSESMLEPAEQQTAPKISSGESVAPIADVPERSVPEPMRKTVVRIEKREVEEVYSVLVENGREYEGPLRAEIPAATESGIESVYPTITAAIADLNVRGVAGAVRLLLVDTTYPGETYPIVLGEVSGTSATYTITIKPQIGVSPLISGTPTATGMFNINGGDYWVFDGSNTTGGATRDMTLRNGATSYPVIRMENGATYNVVKNCKLESSNTTVGAIYLVSTTGTNGNSYNTFTNNKFSNNAGSGLYTAIYSAGSSTARNSNNTITGNEIANFGTYGIYLSSAYNGPEWTISNNHFYNTLGSSATSQYSIYLTGGIAGGGDHVVSGNYIGGSAPNCGGSPWTNSYSSVTFNGIYASCDTVRPSTISNNVIKNISLTGTSSATFNGINLAVGRATISGNTIGDPETPNSILVAGSSTTHGIRVGATNTVIGPEVVSNNVIANMTATGTGTSVRVRGIHFEYAKMTAQVMGNTIHGLSTNSSGTGGGTSSSSSVAVGIHWWPNVGGDWSAVSFVASGNTVHSITAANSGAIASAASGIAMANFTGTLAKNYIYNIRNLSTGTSATTPPIAAGILTVGGAYPCEVSNNMISLGSDESGNIQFNGICNVWGSTNTFILYYNSVRVSGAVVSGALPSFGFRRGDNTGTAVTTTVGLRNNIFCNTRTGGTGKHYSIANQSTVADTTGWGPYASDYNVLYDATPTTVGLWGSTDLSFAGWQTTTGCDAHSRSYDPLFTSATNLHITSLSSSALDGGIVISGITTDFDGETRSTIRPDIGADEFGPAATLVAVSNILGWNMLSNPVSRAVDTDSVRHIYPGSLNAYAFRYQPGVGYQQSYVMPNGPGYWVKFSAAGSSDVTGLPRLRDSIAAQAGWNIVGSISATIDTGTITSNPPGMRASNWWGYGASGYFAATQIVPGKAYWIKASVTGKFAFIAPPLGTARAEHVGDESAKYSSITITDASGRGQTLLFGADAAGSVPVSMYEMPPAPPEGVFDARFQTEEGEFMLQTHRAMIESPVEFGIVVHSTAYPITVNWKILGADAMKYAYELKDGVDGRLFGPQSLAGEGSVVVQNSSLGRFVLIAKAGEQLPTEYALYQNYPNPFNPTTNIKFALPVPSKVTVEIYNLIGQRVRTLLTEERSAGYHVVEWNGTGDADLQLGSGVYFVRIDAKGDNGATFSHVRKLMMLK